MTPEELQRELQAIETRLGELNAAGDWHPGVKEAIEQARGKTIYATTRVAFIRAQVNVPQAFHVEK